MSKMKSPASPLRKRRRGVEALRARYGALFILPWSIGMLLFFLVPIIKSVYYSFAELEITAEGIASHFVGTENFHDMLYVDTNYTDDLLSAFSSLFASLPFILVVSMVLALLLNGNYRGRVFFRGLYFLPVILSSGVALSIFLEAGTTHATEAKISSAVSFNMIDFNAILEGLNLPSSIEGYLSAALNSIFLLVWQSGIQTVLLIAGLQSIPDLLYEVARVEGATKWEEFWFITLPMLLRTMLLVVVFTVVELVSSNTNAVVDLAYNQFNNLKYGSGSAMLWFYYLLVGVLLSLLFLLYKRYFEKKWG